MSDKGKGFTLIELLIVVAIIGILAAIAIPNFLQAQTRSKVARCKADMASTLTAMELYAVDQNAYPPAGDRGVGSGPTPDKSGYHSRVPSYITTPVAYIKAVTYDPFVDHYNTLAHALYPPKTLVGERYAYYNVKDLVTLYGDPWGGLESWVGKNLLYGYGPDKTPWNGPGTNDTLLPYDPTNGITSYGNVIRCQKKTDGIPLHPTTHTYIWP